MVTPGYLPYMAAPKQPELRLPDGACDAHCHVFGPGEVFPYSEKSSYVPVDAPKEALIELHRKLGVSRAVLVQASCHGTDNRAMLDALDAGGEKYRGVAIVDEDITVGELEAMHHVGVRGVRFNFVPRLRAEQSASAREQIIARIATLGWHVVVYFQPEQIAEVAPFIADCPLPVVIDHLGRAPVSEGPEGPKFSALKALVAEHHHVWIKLSCPERLSAEGPPYRDVDPFARSILDIAPDRALWGTDWPHPNMKSHMPDDGVLVDRLSSFATDEEVVALLVANPDRLYWSDGAP